MTELRYSDERDKRYGITGMAITLVVWDADDILSAIDLDVDNDDNLQFIPTFYFAGNPRIPAKASWQHIYRHYTTSIGMSIGNIMCRSHLLDNSTPCDTLRDSLLGLARQEGSQACTLDDDEVQRVFDKAYSYLDRIFSHSGVQQIAHTFADTLATRRRMSRADVLEALASLSRL